MKGLGIFVLSALVLPSPSSASRSEAHLSAEHRKWLEEDVAYIITEKEKDVFLSLETEELRRLFIDAFWAKRDPYPATVENEFEIEHYRRLAYANEHFSRDSPWPGWKTDRGRYYIILGEPASIQRYEGLSQVVTSEIWFYNGESRLRLPARFNLLFFRENDLAPYELYHPFSDGPSKLLGAGATFIQTQHDALRQLSDVSIDLALAAITVDLTDATASALLPTGSSNPDQFFQPASMSSDATLANIAESPKRRIENADLDGFARYRDRVSAEYSFRFVPNRFFAAVLPGPEDTPFVHFILEIDPENFSVEGDDEGRYRTTLDVSVELRDAEDHAVALSNTVPIELSTTELRQVRTLPFAYEDDFPVAVPGTYRLSVTWKNRFSRQFTVAETEIEVPAPGSFIGISDLVTAYKVETLDGAGPDAYLTFQIGRLRLHPAVGGLYARGDTVAVFTAVAHATPGSRVRFSVVDGEDTLEADEVVVQRAPSLVHTELALTDVAPGAYELVAELRTPDGRRAGERKTPLTISPRSEIPRAGIVYREGFYAEVPGLLSLARGDQFLVMGRVDEAIEALRKAVATNNPKLPMARWKLAGALLHAGDSAEALEILRPLEATYPDQYEVVEGLGLASTLKGEHEAAIRYLERAMQIRTPDVAVLNALGISYRATGRLDEAKSVLERSLALDPDQPDIKSWLTSIE